MSAKEKGKPRDRIAWLIIGEILLNEIRQKDGCTVETILENNGGCGREFHLALEALVRDQKISGKDQQEFLQSLRAKLSA